MSGVFVVSVSLVMFVSFLLLRYFAFWWLIVFKWAVDFEVMILVYVSLDC